MVRTKGRVSYTKEHNESKAVPSSRSPQGWRAAPRWRIVGPKGIALGPGKRDLLQAIRQTGSISAGAAELRMSYRRAWTLVETMNRCFRGPLVSTSRLRKAGARLTREGERVLRLYEAMESASLRAARGQVREITKLLK